MKYRARQSQRHAAQGSRRHPLAPQDVRDEHDPYRLRRHQHGGAGYAGQPERKKPHHVMEREKNAGQQRQRRIAARGAPQGVPFPGEQHGRQEQPRKQHPVKRQHHRRRRRQLHEDGGRGDGGHAERDQPIDVAGCLCHRSSFRGQQPSRKSLVCPVPSRPTAAVRWKPPRCRAAGAGPAGH